MLVICNGLTNYHYNGDVRTIDKVKINEFIKDYQSGKLDEYDKAQSLAEVGDKEDDVYNSVVDNFMDIVLDEDWDVFVKFYASWCPHCREMKPMWNDLGKVFNNHPEKGVKIVQLDCAYNDIPGIKISGYPTLYLFRAGQKKKVLEFEGERNVDIWIKFLEKYSPKYQDYLEVHGGVDATRDDY